MPGPRAKYTQSTDNAVRRVNQGLQIICTDPGTTTGDKTAIMREIHERMATMILALGELSPEPRRQKPKRREDPARI
jgi:hypothetical protein